MNLQKLCEKIELQPEVKTEVDKFNSTFDFETISDDLEKLKNMNTEKEARIHLDKFFSDDPNHFKILTCMLLCAVDTYKIYQEKGIDEKIYIDTMKCFTRFISECKESTGVYAFDRAFWTPRQICGVLFRIGELEYEMKSFKNKNVISVHIPSDSIFTEEKCNDSFNQAKLFFKKFFNEFENVDYICESWLMMPDLKLFLRDDSNIVKFQNRFEIKEIYYDDKEFLQWVFKKKNCDIKDLPEKTSLQRKLKQHLLNGGKFGAALGILKK